MKRWFLLYIFSEKPRGRSTWCTEKDKKLQTFKLNYFLFFQKPPRHFFLRKIKNCWMLEGCQGESERNVCLGNFMSKSPLPCFSSYMFLPPSRIHIRREERYTWRYERKANSLKMRGKMHSTSERSAKDKHHAARFSSSLSFSTNLKFLKVQTSD